MDQQVRLALRVRWEARRAALVQLALPVLLDRLALRVRLGLQVRLERQDRQARLVVLRVIPVRLALEVRVQRV